MLKLSSNRLSCHGKLIRWGILGFCSAPIIGTFIYNKGYRIPFLVCPIKHFTGIPCPTCGMTRSFMAIAHGDLGQAFAFHLFGPILFLTFLIAIIHLSLELLVKRRIHIFSGSLIKLKKLSFPGIYALFIYHALRLYHLCQTGELYFAFIHSPLGRFFW